MPFVCHWLYSASAIAKRALARRQLLIRIAVQTKRQSCKDNMLSAQRLAAMPKAELHCHLEGALHLQTLWGFSQRHEPGRYASFREFKNACTVEKGAAPGFKAFLNKFNALRFHYGSLADIERLVDISVRSLGQSAYYREFRFSPVFFARRLLKGDAANDTIVPSTLVEKVAECVIRSAKQAVVAAGLHEPGFIVTCSRHFGCKANKATLDLLERPIGKRISGLDLAGDESVDASDFVKPFLKWKEAGKKITIHAGEDPNAAGPRKIVEAIDVFKADRIGHGVRAIEDSTLVNRLAAEQIPLEICPTSNLQTCAVKSEKEHPLKRLFDAGVFVTINPDDPVICGTTLNDEYAFAARLGLIDDDLVKCSRNAFHSTVIPDRKKFGITVE